MSMSPEKKRFQMKYEDFINFFSNDVKDSKTDSIDALTNENLSRKRNFEFQGIYILCDGDEVVYVGSAYARTIHERLLQYTHDPENDTGNTLVKDIMDFYIKTKEEAIDFIKTLKVYAFEDRSLEYRMIQTLNENGSMIANKAGSHQ